MLDISKLYDERYYLNQNPDVAEAVAAGVFASGLEHFLNFGQREGRDPSALFDTAYYLAQYPDVAEAVAEGAIAAIEHFVNFGQLEGRDPIFEFFTELYVETYPDVAAAVAGSELTPYQHFVEFGLAEGRDRGLLFERSFYLANNPDVARAVNEGQLSAIAHYFLFGKAEGRIANPTADLNAAIELGNLGTAEVIGAIDDRNPEQLYRFILNTPSDFNLELGELSADADVTLLQDLNDNGEIDVEDIVDWSDEEGTATETIARGLRPGTYFVAIEQFEGNTTYNLNLSATPRPDVPPDNVGNTLSEAFDLNEASEVLSLDNLGSFTINSILENVGIEAPEQVGDFDPADIYSFTMLVPNRFRLVLDELSADADVAIATDLDDDGTISLDEIIASSENEGNQSEEIFIPTLFTGEYYIIVEQFEGDTTYNVTLETTPIQFPLSEAAEVGSVNPTPQSVTGELGSANPADTYRFSLDTPSDIQLNLDGLTAGAELYLIQDINSNGIVESGEILSSAPGPEKAIPIVNEVGTYSSDSEALSFVGLSAGNYFVGVNQFQGETNYNLTLSATPTTGKFNTLFGYGLVDAAAAVTRALGESALAEVPEITSSATRNNTGDLNLINAPEVWNRGFTGEGVVVAVLDDGVDWKHPDLADNIWVNPNEIANNGIDDDGNGFVDDVRGWDFVDNDSDPSGGPEDAHGTHVAGTVAAQRNGVDIVTGESTEMNGVAYNATIMPIRALGESKSNPDEEFDPLPDAIRYAVENGAQVLQMSLGNNPGDPPSLVDEEALAFARERGVVAVIASGNERDSYGATRPDDPAFAARNDLAIAIGAVNREKELATFSNPAGPSPLDFVVAPGVEVLSTFPNQKYQFEEGTSMATPHVSGVVALMLQANPNLSPAQVEQILIETAQPEGITLAVGEE